MFQHRSWIFVSHDYAKKTDVHDVIFSEQFFRNSTQGIKGMEIDILRPPFFRRKLRRRDIVTVKLGRRRECFRKLSEPDSGRVSATKYHGPCVDCGIPTPFRMLCRQSSILLCLEGFWGAEDSPSGIPTSSVRNRVWGVIKSWYWGAILEVRTHRTDAAAFLLKTYGCENIVCYTVNES